MAIRRGALPADHFTIISNAWMRDPRLSWKAKGLLAYIAGHAPGHELSSEQIVCEGTDGRDAVRAGLRELEDAGYLVRRQRRGEGGLVAGTDYELTDPEPSGAGKPVAGSEQPEPSVSAGQSSDGKSGAGQPAGKKTTSPEDQEKTPSTSSRGTRLPENWQPSQELIEWTKVNAPSVGWPEVERFRDYWHGVPGQRGRKSDWSATWRNWARRAQDDQRSPAASNGGRKLGPMQEQADRTEQIRQATERVVAAGGSADDTQAVLRELSRLGEVKSGGMVELASSTVETCQPGMYIEGVIVDAAEVGGEPQ